MKYYFFLTIILFDIRLKKIIFRFEKNKKYSLFLYILMLGRSPPINFYF